MNLPAQYEEVHIWVEGVRRVARLAANRKVFQLATFLGGCAPYAVLVDKVERWSPLADAGWVLISAGLPPDETPVLIKFSNGAIRIGELRWETPGFEDTHQAYRYWDDPYDDGQEWEWNDIVEWRHIPK